MIRSREPRWAVIRQLPTPLVTVLTLALVVWLADAVVGWEGSPRAQREAVIAGQEATAERGEALVDSSENDGPARLQLTNVTSGASPTSELMARIGTFQGRFYVVSAGPGVRPEPEGSGVPDSDTLYVFDGATWTYNRLSDPFAKNYLLPEEIETIQEGGPYDVGFLGQNFGVEAVFGDSTYRIREPSLQSERALKTALVAQDPDGERSEQTLPEMLAESTVDYADHIMTSVASGDFGIVVISRRVVDEVADYLVIYSPDGREWHAETLGEVNAKGVIVGSNAFLVLGSYEDDRTLIDASPIYLGQFSAEEIDG